MVTHILDVDPGLAEQLSQSEFAMARNALICRVVGIEIGEQAVADLFDDLPDAVALLVLDGLVARRVGAPDASAVEIVGPGDMLVRADDANGAAEVGCVVLTSTRAAVIDATFVTRSAAWPAVYGELLTRLGEQHRRALEQQAIAHMVGVARRVHAVLWHIGARWGRRLPDGLRLELPATNAILGGIVGASASSVGSAINELIRAGAIARAPGKGVWLLDPALRPGR